MSDGGSEVKATEEDSETITSTADDHFQEEEEEDQQIQSSSSSSSSSSSTTTGTGVGGGTGGAGTNGLNLPLARVKKIIKSDGEIKMVSADTCTLIAKSTELFIQKLALDALSYTQKERRKVIQYKDVSSAVASGESYFFLGDAIPPQKTARDTFQSSRNHSSSSSSSTSTSSYSSSTADL